MNTIKLKTLTIGLTAAVLSFASVAAQQVTNTTREERMDDALQRYRAAHPDADSSTMAPRSESGFKGGVRRTGNAIERGAEKGGNAVKHGLEKVGEAAHRVGDKISEKVNGNKTP